MQYKRNLTVLASGCLLACALGVTAQVTVEWDKTFGGGWLEGLSDAIPTADGGYLLVGGSQSSAGGDKSENGKGSSDGDYWIVKIDSSGQKQWDKTIGGEFSDYATSVIPTADGGYLLFGNSDSPISYDKSAENKGESSDYWLVKIDGNGQQQWDKTFGGFGEESPTSAIATMDGGYLLVGGSDSDASGDKSQNSKGESDYWIIKTDSEGNKLWDKTLGGPGSEALQSVIATADGGYLLGGSSDSDASGDKSQNSKGESDYWIVKIDDNGHKLWDKTLGGTGSEGLQSITATVDGGYLLSGSSDSDASGDKSENSKGGNDYWIVKVDGNGNKLWDKTLGGIGHEGLQSVIATIDAGYLLGGNSNSPIAGGDKSEDSRGGLDYWIVKIDSSGHKLWDKTVGGNAWYGDEGNEYLSKVVTTTDGAYLLAGTSTSVSSWEKTAVNKGEEGSTDYWIAKVRETSEVAVTHLGVFRTDYGDFPTFIKNGDTITIYDDPNLAIVALTNPAQVDKVVMKLSGPTNRTQVEKRYPYSLFGDKLSDDGQSREYTSGQLKAGAYTLTATPYLNGQAGTALTVTFQVVYPHFVQRFALVDADSDQFITELNEGDEIDLATQPTTNLSIQALTYPYEVGKVVFSLEGPIAHTQTERQYPYALFGDSPTGDFRGRQFLPGTYTLKATPYPASQIGGPAGAALEIHFTVIDSDENPVGQITGLDVYDAVTDEKVGDLQPGSIINLNELEHDVLTVVLHTQSEFKGSVRVKVKGPVNHTRIENTKPYSLFGKNNSNLLGRIFPAGEYRLKATAYSEANATGQAGVSVELSFTVVEGENGNARLAISEIKQELESPDQKLFYPEGQLRVYPVPFQEHLFIQGSEELAHAEVRLYGVDGKNYPVTSSVVAGGIRINSLAPLPEGLYIVRILADHDIRSIKVQKR